MAIKEGNNRLGRPVKQQWGIWLCTRCGNDGWCEPDEEFEEMWCAHHGDEEVPMYNTHCSLPVLVTGDGEATSLAKYAPR